METTRILIPGSDAYILAGEYSEFTASLMFFASLCSENPRKMKREYTKAFKSVKRSYKSLLAVRQIPSWITYQIDSLFEDISKNLQGKIEEINFMEINSLVETFLAETLSPVTRYFRHTYLQSAISSHAKDFYSEELFDVVSISLENEEYDAAVLAAFKYLDGILRRLAGIDSYQLYGEELINKIFSPNAGILQINTHPNEQIGLRNWFSGANAVLRNPIAHRFVNLDEKTAQSAIVMVALMAKLAIDLSEKDGQ